MGHEFTPQVEWEVGVTAGKAGDEMVLQCAEGTFGGIVAVNSRGSELVVHLFVLHEFFEDG